MGNPNTTPVVGTLYASRSIQNLYVDFNGRWTDSHSIVIAANSRIGTPAMVFLGIPEAVVHRYVDAIEIMVRLNTAMGTGIMFQHGAGNKLPMTFVGLTSNDFGPLAGDNLADAFTPGDIPAGGQLLATNDLAFSPDKRTGINDSGDGITFQRVENFTPMFFNIDAYGLSNQNYSDPFYNSAIDHAVSVMGEETSHFITKEKYGNLMKGHAEGFDFVLDSKSKGIRYVTLRDDILYERYEFAVKSGLFKITVTGAKTP